MYACMYVRTYVRMYVCMYVCICMYVALLLVRPAAPPFILSELAHAVSILLLIAVENNVLPE